MSEAHKHSTDVHVSMLQDGAADIGWYMQSLQVDVQGVRHNTHT
jgi:hypothetical protein